VTQLALYPVGFTRRSRPGRFLVLRSRACPIRLYQIYGDRQDPSRGARVRRLAAARSSRVVAEQAGARPQHANRRIEDAPSPTRFSCLHRDNKNAARYLFLDVPPTGGRECAPDEGRSAIAGNRSCTRWSPRGTRWAAVPPEPRELPAAPGRAGSPPFPHPLARRLYRWALMMVRTFRTIVGTLPELP
jgi:hypothetical protein